MGAATQAFDPPGSATEGNDWVLVLELAYLQALQSHLETMDVNRGTRTSLQRMVQNVQTSLARGNTQTARHQLAAFVRRVEAQRRRAISDADADQLIKLAEGAINTL